MKYYVSRSQELWEYCGNEPADVVFLLDSSNSIWGPDFRRQLSFVKDVVAMFQIGENATRVGLVTFNDQVDLQFNLKRYHQKEHLLQAIENVRETHGYSTATDLALKYTRTHLFKPRSRNVLRTLIEASRAKRNHAHLFAIGVGHAVNYRELSRMASRPADEYFFQVAGYTALDSLKKILAIKTCQAPLAVPCGLIRVRSSTSCAVWSPGGPSTAGCSLWTADLTTVGLRQTRQGQGHER
ncbi:matrilin-1-like [Babylonia areolata]|uniref:matrilin-1-like n=1 Tax=Babylonia areolata TaxID=304850 RepID=UPI003FD0C84A